MSLRAMLWALYDAPTQDLPGSAFRVLLVLADHAHDDGTAAFPAASTIAERLDVSRRTVERHVAALRDAGLLIPGDQRLVDHVRADRRPMVWDLAMTPRSDNPVGSYGPTTVVGSRPYGPTETGPTVRQKSSHGPTPAVGQNRRTKNNPHARAREGLCPRCQFEHDATTEPCRPAVPMPPEVSALIRSTASALAVPT